MTAIATAAEPLVLVSGYDPAVRAFALAGDGGLKPLAVSRLGTKPSFLVVSADQRFVYACDEVRPGRMLACALDRRDGSLRQIAEASSGGLGPCHASLHPSGRWLFAANYGDGHVAVLPVRADGGIGEPVCNVEVGKQAHMAIPSLSGTTLFVPCKGIDRVVSFGIDVATGRLTRLAAEAATAAGAGPRHLALAADGRSAWLVNELGNTVQPAALDPSGAVRLGAAVATLPVGWSGASTGGGILLAGGLLLASNRGQDSLAVFRLAADGTPTLASHAAVPRTPRHVAVDPSGRWILAACQDADQVAVLRLDAAKAALQPVATVAVPGKPAFVIVVP